MTYEENVLRYIGGYMVNTLSHKFKRENMKYEVEALQEMRGEETSGRGIRGVDSKCGQRKCLCTMEYSMRQHMHMDNMWEMNDTFRQDLSTEIKEDDDVQFHWIILSSSKEEAVSQNILDSTIYLYITV